MHDMLVVLRICLVLKLSDLQQKALVHRKRFAQALEVLRAVDALERQEADARRNAARQANAQNLQVAGSSTFMLHAAMLSGAFGSQI